MATYGLYLESGPRKRRTMVHVFDPLGCIATGPTTEEALAATPDAIAAYRRFLQRAGEPVAIDEPIDLEIVEHITEGTWLGNGSPYAIFTPDFEPVTADELRLYLDRFHHLRGELAAWAGQQTEAELDESPGPKERPAREMLLHVLGATPSYISGALGGAPGFSAIRNAAERGEIGLADALRRSEERVRELVLAAPADARSGVRQLSGGPRTLRQALRRTLEHDWEHLVELSRRPGGPAI